MSLTLDLNDKDFELGYNSVVIFTTFETVRSDEVGNVLGGPFVAGP